MFRLPLNTPLNDMPTRVTHSYADGQTVPPIPLRARRGTVSEENPIAYSSGPHTNSRHIVSPDPCCAFSVFTYSGPRIIVSAPRGPLWYTVRSFRQPSGVKVQPDPATVMRLRARHAIDTSLTSRSLSLERAPNRESFCVSIVALEDLTGD